MSKLDINNNLNNTTTNTISCDTNLELQRRGSYKEEDIHKEQEKSHDVIYTNPEDKNEVNALDQ